MDVTDDAGHRAGGRADAGADWPAEQPDEGPEGCAAEGPYRKLAIDLLRRDRAVGILGDDDLGIHINAAFGTQRRQRLDALIGGLLILKDHSDHFVHISLPTSS